MTCKDCSRFKSGRCAMSDEDNDVCKNFSEKAPTKKDYETLIKVLTDSMKKQDKLMSDIKKRLAELRNRNLIMIVSDYDRGYYKGFVDAVATIEGMISRLEAETAKGERNAT